MFFLNRDISLPFFSWSSPVKINIPSNLHEPLFRTAKKLIYRHSVSHWVLNSFKTFIGNIKYLELRNYTSLIFSLPFCNFPTERLFSLLKRIKDTSKIFLIRVIYWLENEDKLNQLSRYQKLSLATRQRQMRISMKFLFEDEVKQN